MSFRPRIAAALPLSTECACIADWLTPEGYDVQATSPARFANELKSRSFELLVVDAGHAVSAINILRARNPRAPVVVVGDPNPVAESQAAARGATYLTRPLDRGLFTCTITMAIMESLQTRRSQRKRAHFEVVVQGVPSRTIDVSREGLRLEIPRSRKAAPPPPVFDVAVPMLGVALKVRRLWTCSAPETLGQTVWYGGELSHNTRRVEQAWLTLVDALPGAPMSLDLQ